MEIMILKTKVTNLANSRKVFWAGPQGVWMDKGQSLVFDGAFPTLCRDQASVYGLTQEWTQGKVDLQIITNMKIEQLPVPEGVLQALQKSNEPKDPKKTRSKPRPSNLQKERFLDKQAEKRAKDLIDKKIERDAKKKADVVGDNPVVIPKEGTDPRVPSVPKDDRPSDPVNPFQVKPLK